MLLNPTGKGIRDFDDYGSGYFGAPRGKRVHKGVDFICAPGQDILAPISGQIVREAFPYANDLSYRGCLIVSGLAQVKMFYMTLHHTILQRLKRHELVEVEQGTSIGKAQNIANKYKDADKTMTPHVHLELKITQPTLVNPEDYLL